MALAPNPPICLTDLRTEFGDANGGNVCLTEYYAGGANVPSGTSGTNGAVPTSGTICLTDFLGTSAAYYREEMIPDYWTVTGPYNTAQNSGYWELAGQGVFDTLGGSGAPITNFTTTMGGVTGVHYISALRTYIAASGAPLILILTIYNTTGTAYSTSGTITPTSLQAFTNSNYSSGQIVNVTFSSGSKSAGSQYINGSNKESMTITWSTTGYFMTDVFGTNTGYQNGNGTKYIQIV